MSDPRSLSLLRGLAAREFDLRHPSESRGDPPQVQQTNPVETLSQALRRYQKLPVQLSPLNGGGMITVKGTF